MLTREEILNINDRKTETVEIKEWGGSVNVRSLTLLEQAQMADANTATEKKPVVERVKKAQLFLIVTACVDDEGRPLFKKDDVDALMTKSPGAIQTIQDAIFRVSGLSPDAVEDAEKNLPVVQSEDSSSS